VPYDSSAAPFASLPDNTHLKLINITETAAGTNAPVQHTQLVINPYSQKQIVHAVTGIPADQIPGEDISTSLALSTSKSASELIVRGMLDPMDYVNDGLSRVQTFIADMQNVVQPVLDRPLPLVNTTIRQLLNSSGDGIAPNFFNKLQTVVDRIPSSVSLADAATMIENKLGLTSDEFSITLPVGDPDQPPVLSLKFNIN
jgi:hypothetical protein